MVEAPVHSGHSDLVGARLNTATARVTVAAAKIPVTSAKSMGGGKEDQFGCIWRYSMIYTGGL